MAVPEPFNVIELGDPLTVYVTIAFGVPVMVTVLLPPLQIESGAALIEAVGSGTIVSDKLWFRSREHDGAAFVVTLTRVKSVATVKLPGIVVVPDDPRTIVDDAPLIV